MDVAKLEKLIQVTFHNHALVKQAFTHSSYANEHRNTTHADNERLEFLGDAVLELAVSQFLYRKHPDMPEGEMTRRRAAIVCEPSLHRFAVDLGFGDHLLLGKGEEQTGGRDRPAILADVFEAFLGALYLDQGFPSVLQFMDQFIFSKLMSGTFSHEMDYKSQLQELVQQYQKVTVEYRIIKENGPSHDKEFVAEATINGKAYSQGKGRTKKEAEQRAAKHTIDTETDHFRH